MSGIVKYGGGFVVVCLALAMFASSKRDEDAAEALRAARERDNPPRPTEPEPPSSGQYTPDPPKVTRPPLVGARELIKAYDKNEVAADQLYKGRFLRVGGKIASIGKDITGDPYVTLGESFRGVNCYFTDSHADEIAELSKGSPLVFEGQVAGLTIGSVILRHCSIVPEATIATEHPAAYKEFLSAKKRRRHAADDDE